MNADSRGLTLIELLVTIAIIGILAAVIVPRLQVAREQAMIAMAQQEVSSLHKAGTLLFDATGFYPNGVNSWCRVGATGANEIDLSTDAAGLVANGSGWSDWDGPYVSSAEDPWGNPYYLDEDYRCLADTWGCKGIADADSDSGSSVIVSCGPNGATAAGACAYDTDNIVYYLCDT